MHFGPAGEQNLPPMAKQEVNGIRGQAPRFSIPSLLRLMPYAPASLVFSFPDARTYTSDALNNLCIDYPAQTGDFCIAFVEVFSRFFFTGTGKSAREWAVTAPQQK